MTSCVRKPGSVWTSCACDDCRTLSARNSKLYRYGKHPRNHQAPQARKRLEAWQKAGYTRAAIASMTGISHWTIVQQLEAINEGRDRRMHHVTVRRILAASEADARGWVDSTATIRRLRALTVMGWSMGELANRYDIGEPTLNALRNGKHRSTRPIFDQKVLRMYDDLSMTQGPCRLAAARARNRGWLSPLAWDDETIGDAEAQPIVGGRDDGPDEAVIQRAVEGARIKLSRAEQLEVLARLVDRHYSDAEIARRMFVTPRTVIRWRQEHGLASRWAA